MRIQKCAIQFFFAIGLFLYTYGAFSAENITSQHHLYDTSLVTDSAIYIGGEHGLILKSRESQGYLKWNRFHNEELGLVTSLIPIKNKQNEKKSETLVFTTATSKIGKIEFLKDQKEKLDLLYSPEDEQELNALFDIAQLNEQEFIAVGAFGTVLYSFDQGKRWKKLAIDDEIVASSHFYKILVLNSDQKKMSGEDFYIIGEFGNILSGVMSNGTLKIKVIQNLNQATLFDGASLSNRWLILAGVQSEAVVVDLKKNLILNTQLCTNKSIYAMYPDTTSRNVLLGGDGGTIVRLSLLDEGKSSPPALTCQVGRIENSKISDLVQYQDSLIILTRNGFQFINIPKFMDNLTSPTDLKW